MDAQHGIVRAGVAGVDVVHIVGGDHLKVELFGELEQIGNDFLLLGNTVVLNFDEVVFFAEDIDKLGACLPCFLPTVVHQMLRDQRGKAAGEAD